MTRERLFNMRLADIERAMLQSLADDVGETASTILRRMIRERFEQRFGPMPAKKGGR
jgi:hypothetical protein